MSGFDIDRLIQALYKATHNATPPMTQSIIQLYPNNAYVVLISCLLSLRTKDLVTLPISIRLFLRAKTPQEMLALPLSVIESIIRPVNYYKRKALLLHSVSLDLLQRFDGNVPATKEELLSIKGVGLKTANLVLAEAFGIPAICVDIHVHRISNRLGLVATQTPEQTEVALQKILPKKYWILWNRLLVMLGQTICGPQSPWCSKCPLVEQCLQIGVKRSR